MGNSNITLYAVWGPIQAYSVTYISVGADGGTPPIDETVSVSGETATVLDRGTLVRNNSLFREWNVLPDGSGVFTETAAGFTRVFDGSITLADVEGDGDGDFDVLVTGANTSLYDTTRYLNDGEGGLDEAGRNLYDFITQNFLLPVIVDDQSEREVLALQIVTQRSQIV